MSGIISGIGKIFQSVAGSLSTSLGSAVTGVGATVATAAAASSGGLLAQGALKSVIGGLGSGGVLANILSGVGKVVGTAGLGAMAATALPAASGMAADLMPAAASIAGGVTAGYAGGVDSVGGMAKGADPTMLDKAGNFLMSKQGASLVGGLAKGYAAYEGQKSEEEQKQKDRDADLAREMRIRDSYNVPGAALADGASTGAVNDVQRPTPTQQFGSRDFDMVYDPELGRIVRKARA